MTTFKIGERVKIKPLEDCPARVVEIITTLDDGTIYVARYFHGGDAKTVRLFPDELEAA